MSKELEAFDILVQHIEIETDLSDYKKVTNAHEIVEQALQRLEAIDNAKPSEALECLDRMTEHLDLDDKYFYKQEKEDEKIIKQALIKSQEQERVLEIVFKKQVDINEIKILLFNLPDCDDVERCKRYNSCRKVGYKLKQEEFDLLKRWVR